MPCLIKLTGSAKHLINFLFVTFIYSKFDTQKQLNFLSNTCP